MRSLISTDLSALPAKKKTTLLQVLRQYSNFWLKSIVLLRLREFITTGLVFLIVSPLFCKAAAATCSSSIPEPPADIASKVEWLWTNKIKPTVTSGQGLNTFFDQLYATNDPGKFQVCIRWDSHSALTPEKRDCIENMLQRHMGQWTTSMKGYDGWPWDTVTLRVSGWAVYSASDLKWTAEENNNVPIYPGDVSFENAPQCPQACGRFFHTGKTETWSKCPGGVKNHYDFSSWHSDQMDGMGCGSNWGQRTKADATLSGCSGQMIIISHEMGHGFYMPDFYDFTVPGGNPKCVMVAGSASSPQPYDVWCIRRIYSELKRMPGRFPEMVGVKKTNERPLIELSANIDYYAVHAEQGYLKIIPRFSVNSEVQIHIYDVSGRVILTQKRSEGILHSVEIGLLKNLRGGLYIVSITGGGFDESHRINVAD
jgi:hypothetical protein